MNEDLLFGAIFGFIAGIVTAVFKMLSWVLA